MDMTTVGRAELRARIRFEIALAARRLFAQVSEPLIKQYDERVESGDIAAFADIRQSEVQKQLDTELRRKFGPPSEKEVPHALAARASKR